MKRLDSLHQQESSTRFLFSARVWQETNLVHVHQRRAIAFLVKSMAIFFKTRQTDRVASLVVKLRGISSALATHADVLGVVHVATR